MERGLFYSEDWLDHENSVRLTQYNDVTFRTLYTKKKQ